MAEENFLTYPEVDPNSKIAITANRVTYALLTRLEEAYAYSDKGANYFNDNFVHLLTVKITATNSGVFINHWALANLVQDALGCQVDDTLFLYHSLFGGTSLRLTLGEIVAGGAVASDFVGDLALNTPYYLKIVRDENVGTYGTLYCYVYTDAARTTLLDTLVVTLRAKIDFRYIYPVQEWHDDGSAAQGSGYTEDLILEGGAASVLPEVTTLAPTSITPTTATGNGIITSLGLGSVTQHGHCWNTTGSPTTADSKTTNGAGAVGAFTSAITGLTAGTKYYVRAYATNSYGTAYGQGFSFIAGDTIVMMTGNIAVVQSRLHYIDSEGVERYIEGTIA